MTWVKSKKGNQSGLNSGATISFTCPIPPYSLSCRKANSNLLDMGRKPGNLYLVPESRNRLLHRHILALPVAIVTTPPTDTSPASLICQLHCKNTTQICNVVDKSLGATTPLFTLWNDTDYGDSLAAVLLSYLTINKIIPNLTIIITVFGNSCDL